MASARIHEAHQVQSSGKKTSIHPVDEDKDQEANEQHNSGTLEDKIEDVPGTVRLLPSIRNDPPALKPQYKNTTSASPPRSKESALPANVTEKKTARNGQILLNPQPDDSLKDPLNWSAWRKNVAQLSLGLYCMLGGGMTAILVTGSAGVAKTYNSTAQKLVLTTTLYLVGLGVGSVYLIPAAVLFGRRPVYLLSAILLICSAIWCALSPNITSLTIARVLQGIAVSAVECLPAMNIADTFFLHERAFRIGICTFFLFGGKTIFPLVSAAIINVHEWRWVFWFVALVAALCLVLLSLFVPDTFWNRSFNADDRRDIQARSGSPYSRSKDERREPSEIEKGIKPPHQQHRLNDPNLHARLNNVNMDGPRDFRLHLEMPPQHDPAHAEANRVVPGDVSRPVPLLHNLNSPFYVNLEENQDYLDHHLSPSSPQSEEKQYRHVVEAPPTEEKPNSEATKPPVRGDSIVPNPPSDDTTKPPHRSPKKLSRPLHPFHSHQTNENWLPILLRPFILFTYPSILYSAIIYALSTVWLDVLLASVPQIYRNKNTYAFSPLSTGLVYLSPLVGVVLGTIVAGKISDIMVRYYVARRNDGIFEPEFRLLMAIPFGLATAIGLMGYGWAVESQVSAWIIPTIFLGIVAFGTSLAATTAIVFAFDSHLNLAIEIMVALSITKNLVVGVPLSLCFSGWVIRDGWRVVGFVSGGVMGFVVLLGTGLWVWGGKAGRRGVSSRREGGGRIWVERMKG